MNGGSTPPGGETDLPRLLAALQPELDAATYCFLTVPPGVTPPELPSLVTVAEAEGTTLVIDRDLLDDAGPVAAELAAGLEGAPPMARITLHVHSSLEAVGLTAAVSTALTTAGISCNVVAGYFHDHLFVPIARAQDALAVLDRLSTRSAG